MFLRTDKRNGKRLFRLRLCQVTLEITIGLIAVLFLVWGSVKVFLWVNKLLVAKQSEYEAKRHKADRHSSPVLIDTKQLLKDGKIKKLDILGESSEE